MEMTWLILILVHGSVDPTSEEGYFTWIQNNGNRGYAQGTIDYLSKCIKENDSQPLYNIYVRDATGNDPHSILIDKVYYDNGIMKVVLSDNHVGDKVQRDNGAYVYNITDRQTYTAEEFINHYGSRHGNPDILRIFGPNKNL